MNGAPERASYPLRSVPHPEQVAQLRRATLTGDVRPRTADANIADRLPVQLTRFVGREVELDEVQQLVCGNRLVTLTGTGGIGKTRLAVQLAAQFADRFGDEVWYVDLASITDPGLVAVRVARTCRLSDQPGRSTLETLIRFVGDRPMLMVLDNCEHLLDACASLVADLLGACRALTVLATSREPIGVPGEVIWRTPTLALADEAVALFTDRARLVRPDFIVTAGTAVTVDEICRRLDGLPLAIELAAARVRALTLDEILDGLHDRFRLLTGGARTAVPRQQTLRASVDWSHALLSEPERVVFRRLAVFMGGFDLAAAHAVAGDGEQQLYQVFGGLALLVDKSLVLVEQTGRVTRYRLLETVRQYALDKLEESGETDAVHNRHRDHYAALFDAPAGADSQDRIERAETEIDNLRAAFAWSRRCEDFEAALELASSLQPLWLRGRILEGLAWFDAVVTGTPAVASAALARALADKATLDSFAGAFFRTDQAEQALAIARELDDPALLARALTACGAIRSFSPEIALPYFAEAIGFARVAGDDSLLSHAFGWQALSAFFAGDPAAVRTAAEQGRALAETIGDGFNIRLCRWGIGAAELISGDVEGAAAQFTDVVSSAQAAHDPLWSAYGLLMIGKTLARLGGADRACVAARAAIETAADITGYQQALSFGALGDASLAAGEAPAAVTASQAAWQACPQLGPLAINAYPIAEAMLATGDVAAARRWADDTVAAAAGVHRMIALAARVRVAIAQGDAEQADRDAHDALGIAARARAYLAIPDVIECLAVLAVDVGSHRQSARLFGAAAAMRERTGQIRYKVYDAACEASVAKLRAAMGGKDFDADFADGAALSTDEAIGYAHRGRGERKRPSSGWGSLTPAEHDVVRLAGEGLTNKDIAARLFISARTVQTHLTHVYTKLGVSSRVRLVQVAAQSTPRSIPGRRE